MALEPIDTSLGDTQANESTPMIPEPSASPGPRVRIKAQPKAANSAKSPNRQTSGRYAGSGRHSSTCESKVKVLGHSPGQPKIASERHMSSRSLPFLNPKRTDPHPRIPSAYSGCSTTLPQITHSMPQLPRLYKTDESPRKEDVDVREWKFDKNHKSWCQGMEKRLRDEKERSKRLALKAETKVASMIEKIRESEQKLKEKQHETEHRRKQGEVEQRDKLLVIYKEVHDRIAHRTKANLNKLRNSLISGLLVSKDRSEDFDPFKPTELELEVIGEEHPATPGDINLNPSSRAKLNSCVQAPAGSLPGLTRTRSLFQAPPPITNKLGRLRDKDGALVWTSPPTVTPNVSEAGGSISTEDESVWIKPGHFRTFQTSGP